MTTRRRRRIDGGAGQGRSPDHYDGLDEDLQMIPGVDIPDEVSTSVPSARVREILERASARASATAPAGGTEDDELNPTTRLEQVRRRAPEYEREYRLRLIQRLLMRRLPLDEIASQLSVSVRTVERDRTEIYERLRDESSRLDINALLGETMAYYGETGAMAMRIATSLKTAVPHKLAALRTAMTSRKEMGQWLSTAGVFDVLKFQAKQAGQSGDLSRLMALTEKIFSEEDIGDMEKFTEEDLDDQFVSMLL